MNCELLYAIKGDANRISMSSKGSPRACVSLSVSRPLQRHSRDNPDLDSGHGRTLEVPHHPEVVLVAGVAGVGDVLGRGIDGHRNHVRVQPGPASGGEVPGILPPQKAEPGPFLKKAPS